MDIINSHGEKIGSLTHAVSSDTKHHHQPNPRCYDCQHPRPQHGEVTAETFIGDSPYGK